MNTIVLIRFEDRYEDINSDIGVAENIQIAEKYTAALAKAYPYAYGKDCGMFTYTPFEVITENDIKTQGY